MDKQLDRRTAIRVMGGALVSGAGALVRSAADAPSAGRGCVVGQPDAERAGQQILDAGGNAVDAIVAAAWVAGVTAIHQCGPGGYGGHMTIALAGKNKVACIDFNTVAPAAATPDIFKLDAKGTVIDRGNSFGWRAFGVPGVPAGLQLARDRFGALPLRKLVQPAIQLAREGFKLEAGIANAIRSSRAQLGNDAASMKLLFENGEPRAAGNTYRNPDLARMLESFAEQNSVDSFYRGDIAKRIAAEAQKHGGVLTAADLAAYQAREVEPLRFAI